MPENNQILSLEGQLIGMPLAGPESFTPQQLAYLKRALGVDETVLWSGTYSSNTTSITLSESYLNFDIIEVHWSHNNVTNEIQRYETAPIASSTSRKARWLVHSGREDSNGIFAFTAVWIQDTETTFKKSQCFYRNIAYNANNNGSAVNELVPIKIVGIHRIAGGN